MTGDGPKTIRYRGLTVSDATAVHRLVSTSGVLEPNSPYAYLLLCSDFATAGVLAEGPDGTVIGFVVGYRPPSRPKTLFVWQVGVADTARGQGIGGGLLDALARRNPDATHLEATVAPSNAPSRALFTAFARRWDAPCEVGEGFTPDQFPGADHEAEHRYRIGPLRRQPS